MAKTPKLKKTGFCFLIIKGSIFNIFKNGKKLHTLQLFLLNKVKIVSHKKCYLATFRYVFAFLPKKGSLIFKIQKKRLTNIIICPKDSKKVNIFEIGSLEVYHTYTVFRPYMYVYKYSLQFPHYWERTFLKY